MAWGDSRGGSWTTTPGNWVIPPTVQASIDVSTRYGQISSWGMEYILVEGVGNMVKYRRIYRKYVRVDVISN